MAERKADAARERTIAQPMQAEGFFPPTVTLIAATNGGDPASLQRRNGTRRCLPPQGPLACAHAAPPRQNLKQTDGNFDTVLAGHAAEVSRALPVAANANVKRRNAIDRLGAQAHVGGYAVEIDGSAAVDLD